MTKFFEQDARDNEPVLWILMRNDLASLNPGKAVAQGAHAANLALSDAQDQRDDGNDAIRGLLSEWEADRGFGTTITLAIDGAELAEVIDLAQAMGLVAGVVHDPTYPLRDGQVTHLIPLDTCGYVFARRVWIEDLLDDLVLMP